MKIINVRKDGSIVEDLKKVIVPKNIVANVSDIAKRKTEIRRKANGNGNKTRIVGKE